jgi:ubiquinone/menaquinone biosynthesis C-methylase UbiE
MDTVTVGILDDLSTLADPVRSRMLVVLERNELTVTELCSVLQLPQSTVSRHLKMLGDAGWVVSRRDGTSRFYTHALPHGGNGSRKLWLLVREQIAGSSGAAQDARRLASALARRRSASQEFFATAAGQWDRVRDELFGAGFYLEALLALLDRSWRVGDLGCGTGQVSAALAPFVARVVSVDESGEMLAAARRRLRDHDNVELRRGDLESLPLDDAELDVALMVLVLHHLGDPGAALREAARALKPAGRLLIADMLPHDHDEYKQQMGHVWLGFRDEQLATWLAQAGFTDLRIRPLPPRPDARGPALLVATATRK